jgi:1,4-dihydroxy-2-naphthoate octaprenyltransferase
VFRPTFKMIRTWLQAIRLRFLLASVIAVSNGIALAFWKNKQVDLPNAILTFVGVICLHASIDLLNDYWDYKRGIDTATQRTKFSGGTGVLPDNLLKPRSVYSAGLILLLLGHYDRFTPRIRCIGCIFLLNKYRKLRFRRGFCCH